MLLGEQLIAFRDTDGRVGIMEHRCPHRCASLFFGRNEEDGLRCVYHGWKFDVEGNCLDMPNVPPAQDFKDRIKAKAYRVVERAGFVWTYMGQRKEAPPLPNVEVLMLPEEERLTRVHMRECNWFQSLEGDIDTSHFGFLHVGGVKTEDVDPTRSTAGPWASARRTTNRPRPSGARCMRRTGRPSRAPITIALPTSCSRSSRSRPTASSRTRSRAP